MKCGLHFSEFQASEEYAVGVGMETKAFHAYPFRKFTLCPMLKFLHEVGGSDSESRKEPAQPVSRAKIHEREKMKWSLLNVEVVEVGYDADS